MPTAHSRVSFGHAQLVANGAQMMQGATVDDLKLSPTGLLFGCVSLPPVALGQQ